MMLVSTLGLFVSQLGDYFELFMGGAQPTKPADNEGEALTINHPRFSQLKVVSPPTEDDEGVVEIQVALPSEAEFKRWDKRVTELPDFENAFLPLQRRFEKTEFCGSGGIATIAYTYYPYLLSDEVINRRSMDDKFFQQSELWYLVYSIINAGKAFHASGIKLGDVRPQNIFISPEGQVKVATQFTWPNEQTNYLKTVFDKETTYLSPQELRDINYGKLEEPADFALNEAFSIGLTCLDAATLTDSSSLYQSNANKFNYGKLDERILALEKGGHYSLPLVLLIKGLCQTEESKRISCHQVAQWLNKYEGFIIDLQDFEINELPEQLNRLAPEKPKPQSQLYPQLPSYQYNTQIPPQPTVSLPNPYPSVSLTRLQQPAPQTQYQQYIYQPQHFQTYVGNGSGINNRTISQGSNNNPSIITFQKDPRSTLQNPTNSQLRGASINLQQIDEQLQMSRKLFPS